MHVFLINDGLNLRMFYGLMFHLNYTTDFDESSVNRFVIIDQVT